MSRKLSLKELREAFKNGCDLQNIECDWSELDGCDWSWLLSTQPKFADKCDWKKLNGWDWCGLLCKHPQFADKCDWKKLDGEDWSVLLCNQPKFADKCDWKKLDGGDWSWLLSRQPQFADKCDWNKLNGWDWSGLLCKHPQFADKCDSWDELDSDNWRFLLSNQPQFADKYKLYQILFLKQEGDSIVVYCKGERKFDWDLYDGGALITAIDDLRKIIETLPPADGAELVEQGITIDTEDFALALTLEAELNLEVWNINDIADDEEDEE